MAALIPFFPAFFVVLWSTGFIGTRYAMPHAEPFTFLILRFVLALVLLAPLIALYRAPWPRRAQFVHAAIAGALIHGVYLGGVFVAIRHGLPAGITALVVGLQPVIAALLAALFLAEKIGPRHWLGLALGLLGVAVVVGPGAGAGVDYRWQTLLPAFLSAVGMAAGAVWQKRFVASIDLRTGTFVQYLGALVLTIPLALLFETGEVEWTAELVLSLFWLTVVLSIGAIFLLMFLIREGAVSRVSSLMYLTPGTTAVMAYALFSEALTLLQLVGLVISGVGVAAAMRAPPPRGT